MWFLSRLASHWPCFRTIPPHITHQAVLVFVIILALHYRIRYQQSIHVLVPEPKFQPLLPGSSVRVIGPSTDISSADYSKLIDLEDFKFDINIDSCSTSPSGLLLLVMVTSNADNFQRREFIRRTYGGAAEATRVVFLVGRSSNPNITQKLDQESLNYKDIIKGNFNEAYKNMTYKHVMGLKWVTYHCKNVRYILKLDDDTVVNIDELHRFLVNEISPWGAKGLIACQLLHKTRPQRTYRSKWRVSHLEYPNYYYPDYCAGWAILYSADVVYRLYVEAQKTKYFWIDDALITGILAERAEIGVTPLGDLQLTLARMNLLTVFKPDLTEATLLFSPPDLQISTMTEIWNMMLTFRK